MYYEKDPCDQFKTLFAFCLSNAVVADPSSNMISDFRWSYWCHSCLGTLDILSCILTSFPTGFPHLYWIICCEKFKGSVKLESQISAEMKQNI